MAISANVKSIMKDIKNLDIKDEIKLMNMVSENIYRKINNPDNKYWQKISEHSLNKIWNNPEDDIYNELLKR